MDFVKAVQMVSHITLPFYLQSYGACGQSLNLYRSFLAGRPFAVKADPSISYLPPIAQGNLKMIIALTPSVLD